MSLLTESPAIGYVNYASGKTISVSSANPSFPGSNLNNSLLSGDGATYRSATNTITNVNIDLDLNSSLDIDVIALLGVNFSDTATRTPKTSESSSFSTTEYNPGSGSVFNLTYSRLLDDIPDYGRHLIVLPGQTYNSRYTRLTISDSSNLYGYLKASVYWVGPLYQFTIADTNDVQGMDSSSEPILDFVGSPGIEKVNNGWKVVIKALNESTTRKLLSTVKNKLRSGRYLFIPHPKQPETFIHEVGYCNLVGFKRFMLPSVPTTWQVEIEFREVES